MPLARRASLLAVLALLPCVSILACSDIQLEFGPTKPLPAKLAVVYPYRLRYDAPAYKSFELAMDEVAIVLDQKRLGVIGPDEFKIMVPDDQAQQLGIFSSTNVAGILPGLGVLPGNVVALRGWAERREQKFTSLRYDAQGKPEGRKQDVEVTMVAHLDLYGPNGSAPLAEAKVEFQVDPFADHPLYDDSPELRRQVRRLTERILSETRSVLETEPQPSDPGFEYLYNPRNAETFSLANRPPYAQALAAMDPASREAAAMALLLYFYPELPIEQQQLLLQLPTGLLVTRVTSPIVAMNGLQVNDLIIMAEQTPVAGPQTLLRFMGRKDPGMPVQLVVQRGPAQVHLWIPSPQR
jgi:hypothetical protein